jgi:hypothetical protein
VHALRRKNAPVSKTLLEFSKLGKDFELGLLVAVDVGEAISSGGGSRSGGSSGDGGGVQWGRIEGGANVEVVVSVGGTDAVLGESSILGEAHEPILANVFDVSGALAVGAAGCIVVPILLDMGLGSATKAHGPWICNQSNNLS